MLSGLTPDPSVAWMQAASTIRPVPQAAPSPQERPTLQTNGIVRTTVFPNAVRKLRVAVPEYANLQGFCAAKALNYTRVGKIERGEIFPKASELTAIANAMDVETHSLIIDVTAEEFDYESWARENIEASLSNRGGGEDAMVLGAYLRMQRLREDKSIGDVAKTTGVPEATLSRVENALFPISRLNAGVTKALGQYYLPRYAEPFPWLLAAASDAYNNHQLDDLLNEMFGRLALEHRNQRQLIRLLRDLATPKLEALADKMERLLQMVARDVKPVAPPSDVEIVETLIADHKKALMDTMTSFENQMKHALPKSRHTLLVLTHIEIAKLYLREHLDTYQSN